MGAEYLEKIVLLHFLRIEDEVKTYTCDTYHHYLCVRVLFAGSIFCSGPIPLGRYDSFTDATLNIIHVCR